MNTRNFTEINPLIEESNKKQSLLKLLEEKASLANKICSLEKEINYAKHQIVMLDATLASVVECLEKDKKN